MTFYFFILSLKNLMCILYLKYISTGLETFQGLESCIWLVAIIQDKVDLYLFPSLSMETPLRLTKFNPNLSFQPFQLYFLLSSYLTLTHTQILFPQCICPVLSHFGFLFPPSKIVSVPSILPTSLPAKILSFH